MNTRIDEIADGIFRLSTPSPDAAPPAVFTFNQYLVKADQPLLFHCGQRGLFPSVSAAAAKIIPLESLRWIAFGHVEADECGSMNQWLAAAPLAQVIHGQLACMVSLNDLADRLPRPLADGEVMDLGGKRVRWIDTPHVPHAWESGLLYEETTGTLFTGDLFSQLGDGPAIGNADIVADAIKMEDVFHVTSLTPQTADMIRGLKRFELRRLAVMHGASYEGDCASAIDRMADYYAQALRDAISGARA